MIIDFFVWKPKRNISTIMAFLIFLAYQVYITAEDGESKLSVKLKTAISFKKYLFTEHMNYRMVNLLKLVRCSI